MKVKQFKDKYDKEFVSILLEINKRIEDLPKADKLKITSWIKALSLPTNSIPWKKNRNLYSILLFDNLINNRLEAPFNKFAQESSDLPVLSSSMIKSILSKKFYEEIKITQPNDEIQNFINLHCHFEEVTNANTAASTPSHKTIKQIPPVLPKTQYNKSDILLNKPYFGFQNKLGNERAFIENINPQCEKLEKYKSESIIQMLQKETAIKGEIIINQAKDIENLQKRRTILESKVKKLFN